MNSIILSPYQQKILSRHLKSGNHPSIEHILFSMLINDSTYLFEHTITEQNFKILEKLKNYGLIEMFPHKYLSNSLEKIGNQFSSEMERRIRSGDDDERHRVVSLNNTSEDRFKLNEITRKSQERRSNILFSRKYYSQEIIEYEEFISAFRTNNNKLSKGVYSAFANIEGIHSLFNFLESNLFALLEAYDVNDSNRYSLSFMKKHWDNQLESILDDFEGELENQRNLFSLYGIDEKFLDKFPAKKFVYDYIDLLEAKLQLDASFQLSSEEGVPISIGLNSGKSVKVQNESILSNSKDNYHQVYQILLNEINFPKISSIDELMRLKENKNIVNFKKQIETWNEALANGELKELEKIKKSVSKANKSLERIEIRKSQNWVFFVSIPILAASVVTGIPFSVAPLAYTGLLKLDNVRLKRKYNWIIS